MCEWVRGYGRSLVMKAVIIFMIAGMVLSLYLSVCAKMDAIWVLWCQVGWVEWGREGGSPALFQFAFLS